MIKKTPKAPFHGKMGSTRAIFSLLFLFLILPSIEAEIKSITMSSERSPIVILEEFRFTHVGYFSIDISSFQVEPQTIPTSQMGFFLSSMNYVSKAWHIMHHNDSCVLDIPFIQPLLTMDNYIALPKSSCKRTFSINNPGRYALYFINCGHNKSKVSMSGHIEMYNIDSNGNRNYLQDGFGQLPSIFLTSSLSYLVILLGWTWQMQRRKAFVKKIHFLMAMLLFVRSLDLFCLAIDKHYVKTTGTPHGWHTIWCLLHFIRSLLLALVIALVGEGWSFLRSIIKKDSKPMVICGIVFQAFSSIFYLLKWEIGYSSDEYIGLVFGFFAFDLVSCSLLLAPIISTMKLLKRDAEVEGKAARNLRNLKRFRNFFVAFLIYVSITRFGMSIVRWKMFFNSWNNYWMAIAFEQMVNWVFYVVMFYTFRPTKRYEYYVSDEVDEEAALLEIQRMIDVTKFFD